MKKKILLVLLCVTSMLCLCFGLSACVGPEKESYNGFTFTIYGDYCSVEMGDSKDKDIVIPSTYKDLPVKCIEAYGFRNCAFLTSVSIPDSITAIEHAAFEGCSSLTSIIIPDSVTAIGFSAFQYCTSLTRVTLGDNVCGIGDEAFSGCEELTEIRFPDSLTKIGINAFRNCSALSSVNFGDGMVLIEDGAFQNCNMLDTITLYEGVITIGDDAFSGCSALKSVTLPDSLKTIGENAFEECPIENATIPALAAGFIVSINLETNDCLKTVVITSGILTYNFRNCAALTSIGASENNASYKSVNGNLYSKDGKKLVRYAPGKKETSFAVPDGVTKITGYAFANCDSLENITIPDSVENIEFFAFTKCYKLKHNVFDRANYLGNNDNPYLALIRASDDTTTCIINDTTKVIADSAFYKCEEMTSVAIPDSVKHIGKSAFNGCRSLTGVSIPDSVTSIGSGVFADCSSLASVTLPDSVSYISESAFSDCISLESISLPDNVTSIGENAFSYCSSLKSIKMPDGVKRIGVRAFKDCGLLTSVILSDTVTDIGESAFQNCVSLNSIMIPYSVTYIGNYVFNGCSALVNIEVSENNEKYKSIDGNLYKKDGKFLIQYAIGKKAEVFAVPESVTNINGGAFSGCSYLKGVTVPDSVTSIGYAAFYNCNSIESITIPFIGASQGGTYNRSFEYIFGNVPPSLKTVVISGGEIIEKNVFRDCSFLTSITIPESVNSIEHSAFQNCSSLKDINFEGTKKQWNLIAKGTDWNLNTGNYSVHCTDGDIEKS